ncbi:MAG: FGGY family carbohydrate kinase [Geminicoccaceae bacterium]
MRALAIDQGTTSTRALAFDEVGSMTTVASFTHRQNYPRPGWVEHDPLELLDHVRACMQAAAGLDDLVAIGIDNQGESCLAWDGTTGEPVSPVIVWQDDRTAETVRNLEGDGLAPLVMQRAGLPLDPYFSASKLAWILREIPRARELHAAGRLRLGTTDAFFLDRLCGRFVTDISTASRTSLMNLRTGGWDRELCRIFGVPIECLPEITSTTGTFGTFDCNGRDIPLAASIVDQQAALYGHGCRNPGDVKITFGTGAFALALTGSSPVDASTGALPTIAWRKQGEAAVHALDGGVYCASSAVNWARDLGLFSSFEQISAFDRPPACTRGLIFVPALAGLACPHWQRQARGAWFGLSLHAEPADMVMAMLEGIAFRTAEVLEVLGKAVDLREPVSIDGGMAANGWFCQFLADVLEREVMVSRQSELTALGTATLAAEGAGHTLSAPIDGRRLQPSPLPPGSRELFARAREMCETFGRISATTGTG